MQAPRQRAKAPHLATLVLLTALSVLSLNMFLPALPAMRDAFGTSEAVIGLAISGYMALAAVLQLILGPVSDRLGRRPVLLVALGFFSCASVLCLASSGVSFFLVARMGQTLAVAGAVLASAVVRDLFDETEAAAKLGLIGAAMALAPMLGPMLGGYLEAWAGWRALFALYAGLGLLALVLVWVDLPETHPASRRQKRAYDLSLLAHRLFWAYALTVAFSVGTFYIFVTGAPFVASAAFGLAPQHVGIGLGSITAGFMCGATLSARFVRRIGPGRLILTGRALAVVATSGGVLGYLLGADHMALFFVAVITVGFGNGLTVANANAGLMSLKPEIAGTAAGLGGAILLAVGSGLTALVTLVLSAAATPERLLGMMTATVLLSALAGMAAVRGRR